MRWATSNFHWAVWVSAVPASVKAAVKVIGVPIVNTESDAGPVIVTTGATLLIVRLLLPEALAVASEKSVATRVRGLMTYLDCVGEADRFFEVFRIKP